jgi:hypothetical protein
MDGMMLPPPTRLRWYQFGLKSLLVAFFAASILFAYVGSYYRVSRRGMEESRQYRGKAFMYVPIDEFVSSDRAMTMHCRMQRLYYPANFIDVRIFGGMDSHNGISRIVNTAAEPAAVDNTPVD